MTQAQPARRIGRSILAVLAGMVVAIALTLGSDKVLRLTGIFPPLGQSMVGYDGAFLLATVYRTVYGVLGSYLTAWLAPARPMKHALVGGYLGVAANVVGVVVAFIKGPALGPLWYPLALVVLALPTAWMGGKLRVSQLSTDAPR
jgi:hypothetical protein